MIDNNHKRDWLTGVKTTRPSIIVIIKGFSFLHYDINNDALFCEITVAEKKIHGLIFSSVLLWVAMCRFLVANNWIIKLKR